MTFRSRIPVIEKRRPQKWGRWLILAGTVDDDFPIALPPLPEPDREEAADIYVSRRLRRYFQDWARLRKRKANEQW